VQEQFQWNGVYSKRTDEGLGDCWMRGKVPLLLLLRKSKFIQSRTFGALYENRGF